MNGAERGLDELLVAATRTYAWLPYLCDRLLLHLDICTNRRIAIGYLFSHDCSLVLSSIGCAWWKRPRQHLLEARVERQSPILGAFGDFTSLNVKPSSNMYLTHQQPDIIPSEYMIRVTRYASIQENAAVTHNQPYGLHPCALAD